MLPFEIKGKKVITLKEAETNPEFGCEPEKRSVKELIDYGIINLNKPSGPTSHQVADYVKKILNVSKAGHSGTLDPGTTGVLPIALEKATRVVQALLPAGKEYVALMYLHSNISPEDIKRSSSKFIGKITQLPPRRSAIKRVEREREVYYLDILEISDRYVLFKIGCQAGTYIRKICHDWGLFLKSGAHMKQLVRTKAGPFTDKDMFNLQDLKDAYEFYKEGSEAEIRKIIKPFETAIQHLPKVWILDSAVNSICHGSPLYFAGISKLNEFEETETVAILTLKNEVVALGKSLSSSKEIFKKDKLAVVKTDAVFRDTNFYATKQR